MGSRTEMPLHVRSIIVRYKDSNIEGLPGNGFLGSSSVNAPPRRLAPRAGLEPATTRLTAECSTIELSRIALRNSMTDTLSIMHKVPHKIFLLFLKKSIGKMVPDVL